MLIDTHVHLNEKIDGTAKTAARDLNSQLEETGIDAAVVLQLENQPWSSTQFIDAISNYPRLKAFVNIHPYKKDANELLRYSIEQQGFIGLKLHPRLQNFDIDDLRTYSLVRYAGEMEIPVLICAFPDGTQLMSGFSPIKYALLAKGCEKTKIIWAHMGGHMVIDFLMLAKRLPNVFMDTSYSLLYYRGSSIISDIVYAMHNLNFNRIFYGSDYPDRSIKTTFFESRDLLIEYGIDNKSLNKIFGGNAAQFFGFNILRE